MPSRNCFHLKSYLKYMIKRKLHIILLATELANVFIVREKASSTVGTLLLFFPYQFNCDKHQCCRISYD